MKKPERTEEKTKTSIKVDPELWKEAKIASIQNNIELSQIVEDGLRAELNKLKRQTEVRP
jgi:post-segregation antitoxin (ccd killing protein)